MEVHEEMSESSESKEDKFRRLAGMRVNNALQKIRIIGNLASSGYSYTPEQIEKIIVALKGAIEEVEAKFQKKIEKDKDKFEL